MRGFLCLQITWGEGAQNRSEDAPAIEALRIPAFNDSVNGRGLPSEMIPLSRWQRFVAWVS